MIQILQDLGRGKIRVANVPCARTSPGELAIRSRYTLISAGTERMLLEFGKANLLDKARQQPEKARAVINKIRTDGLFPTLEAVRARLDQPLALGYSNAGVILEVGPGVTGFAVGDRAVSNGSHAEIVHVPKNLCAMIPDNVSDEAAAFTVVGAIALQGIRLAQPALGENFVVTGLGVIGLITVQLLRAQGCQVLAIDLDSRKLGLARRFGAETVDLAKGEDPIAAADRLSRGRGVDGVLITAAARSSEPVHHAALMCRKRGRIVLVGVAGLQLSREDFYKKELSFQVSCSYGPGRYDPDYEQGGHDYPYAFVRWTAQRNFEAVLNMLSDGRLDVTHLITHRFPVEQAAAAYDVIQSDTPYLGVLLEYSNGGQKSDDSLQLQTIPLAPIKTPHGERRPVVGFVGAGNYATRTLIPAFLKSGAELEVIVSNGGVSAACAGRKFGFRKAGTDPELIFGDSRIDTVVIVTRHDSHARLVCEALRAGKNVFVEKPLALNREELYEIENLYRSLDSAPVLMVGFNRRFAPQVQKMKALLDGIHVAKAFIMTVNAGAIPPDHWTQDLNSGGGRVIGEACHFVDLLRFLAGAPILAAQAVALSGMPGPQDKVTFTLKFSDGSVGTIHYLANGNKAVPKERLEVFCAGRVLQLENFRALRGYGWQSFRKFNLWRQDKGNSAAVVAFLDAVRKDLNSPIPFEELVEVTRVTQDVAEAVAPC